MTAYYNDSDPASAHVLRALIADGVIADGIVDDRSIKDVQPNDLDGFTQCHFFAGGGLWSVALRMAGWSDDRPVWTGSCPCQPFSGAGKGGGANDPRHLWPDFFRLIRTKRPAFVVGEQVAGKAGYGWLDGVRSDLADEEYTSGAVDFPACSVNAPQRRNRLYWIAVADANRFDGRRRADGRDGPQAGNAYVGMADANGRRRAGREEDKERRAIERNAVERLNVGVALGDADSTRLEIGPLFGERRGDVRQEGSAAVTPDNGRRGYWDDAEWIQSADGKVRRTKPGLPLLVDGFPGRVDLWRIAGNGIVPQAAAEVIRAFLDVEAANDNAESA